MKAEKSSEPEKLRGEIMENLAKTRYDKSPDGEPTWDTVERAIRLAIRKVRAETEKKILDEIEKGNMFLCKNSDGEIVPEVSYVIITFKDWQELRKRYVGGDEGI